MKTKNNMRLFVYFQGCPIQFGWETRNKDSIRFMLRAARRRGFQKYLISAK